MAVPVQCEQCQAKYLIEDRFAGKRAKCKRCGHVMSIPMPAGPGGSPALANDDTGGTGEMGMLDLPFGSPGPRGGGGSGSPPIPQGITSQPPRGWRPQDIVVEREDDVTEFALASEGAPIRITSRPAGRTYDGLVPLLLLVYAAVIAYLGWSGHSRLDAKYPPEVVSAAGGWLKAAIWSQAGLMLVGLFAIAGPLILAGLAGGLKIRHMRLPGSAYLKACALAAIPGSLMAYAMILRNSESSDEGMFAGALLLAAVGGFFAVRFIIGLDWISSGICFALAAILGVIGTQISARAAAGASEAVFMPTVQREIARAQAAEKKTRLARATRNDIATAPPPAPSPSPAPAPGPSNPPPTPDPAPAPVPPPAVVPATATPQKPGSALFDVDGLGDPAPAPEPKPAPNTPAPVAVAPVPPPNVPVVPVRIQPSKGEPEERDTLIETALDDVKLRVKATAGDAVADISATALKPDVIAVVRPPGPSSTFAVVRRAEGAKEDVVEVYTGNPPAKLLTANFAFEVAGVPNYAISADGQRLARVSEFPKLALRVTSADGKEVSSVDLDSKNGTPRLLAFLSADRVLVRWENNGLFGLEIEDLKTHKHGKQLSLPEHDSAASSNAISPDGRLFATAVRSPGKPVTVVVHNLLDGARKQLVVKSLDPRWAIRPAGLAFSGDGNKLAALFVQSGAAVVAAWNPRSGASLPDLTVSTAVQPLKPLPGSGEAGNAGGGVPGPAGANSLAWLGNGSALLACGSALVGAANGGAVADFGVPDAFGQSVVSENAVRVWYCEAQRPAGVLTITLAPKSLPAAGGASRAATPAPAGKR